MNESALVGVQIPVEDVAAAMDYYRTLGLDIIFRDGERYGALKNFDQALFVAAPSEQVLPGKVCILVKVPDLEAAIREVRAAGGRVETEIEQGPHETRVGVIDPMGNATILFTPAPPA
ncbi:VOC family protein [Nocardia sp. NPDC059239]|uniref:VOC family protein n=1 Tax=unclassified Nocardia TaxID=2637762 RepID=UPI0036A8A139